VVGIEGLVSHHMTPYHLEQHSFVNDYEGSTPSPLTKLASKRKTLSHGPYCNELQVAGTHRP
jgi:hypothetical protein